MPSIQGERSIVIHLSDYAHERLGELAKKLGKTRKHTVEKLIEDGLREESRRQFQDP